MTDVKKVGFGGGCHWCTEAVFSSIIGAEKVEQGWIASQDSASSFSEAVLVHFDSKQIDLHTLINIHLHTHSSTSAHSMRHKYRSAIYCLDDTQCLSATHSLQSLQNEFDRPLVTQVLPFLTFKLNSEKYRDYYYSNPDKPFCQNYIDGKIATLLKQFSRHANAKAKRVVNQ